MPTPRPILNLNFVPGVTPSILEFSRSGAATYVDHSGIVRSAAAGVLRDLFIDGRYYGKMVEPAATNQALYNRDLTQTSKWTATSVTTAKTSTGADGASNAATRVTASGTNGTIAQAVTLTSSSYVLSMRLKRVTGTGTISISLDGGSTYTDVTSQLSTAVYTRVYAVQTLANPTIQIKISTSGDAIDVDYVQLEANVFPTSDIEVPSTSPVARVADTAYVTLANIKDGNGNAAWIASRARGTFFAEGMQPYYGSTSNFPMLASLTAPSTSDFIGFFWNDPAANDPVNYQVLVSGVVQASGTLISATTAGGLVRCACAFDANNFAAAGNGGAVQTDSAGSVATNMDKVALGYVTTGSTTYRLTGAIKRIALWNVPIYGSDLQKIAA